MILKMKTDDIFILTNILFGGSKKVAIKIGKIKTKNEKCDTFQPTSKLDLV